MPALHRPRLHPLAFALLFSLSMPALAVDTPPAEPQDSQDRHTHETELKTVEIKGDVVAAMRQPHASAVAG